MIQSMSEIMNDWGIRTLEKIIEIFNFYNDTNCICFVMKDGSFFFSHQNQI